MLFDFIEMMFKNVSIVMMKIDKMCGKVNYLLSVKKKNFVCFLFC